MMPDVNQNAMCEQEERKLESLPLSSENLMIRGRQGLFLLAVDHTRVRLRAIGKGTVNGKEKDEYLNANYVDGFRKPRAYIATQVIVAFVLRIGFAIDEIKRLLLH